MDNIIQILASELERKPEQIEAVVTLLDEGNTIPFIARYRMSGVKVSGQFTNFMISSVSSCGIRRSRELSRGSERHNRPKPYPQLEGPQNCLPLHTSPPAPFSKCLGEVL